MKLAEALLLRSDMDKKLLSLQSRAQKYAIVQEGEQAAEDPNELLLQVDAVCVDLERLLAGVNAANIGYRLKSGKTLTEALARRDVLTKRHAILASVVEACSKPRERYGMSEIRWVALIQAGKVQKQMDDLSKEIRELNASIQEANWQVEIDL